jgi:alkylation response protein AidB-like acyl-CoA dehydrogenase
MATKIETASIAGSEQPTASTIIARLRRQLPAMQARAGALERKAAFPLEDVAALRSSGALAYFARPQAQPLDLMEALRLVGRGNLSVGRIFEGHVNAAGLVDAYGDARQKRRLHEQLAAGEVFGVWNTERPPGVRVAAGGEIIALTGRKCFATGAGYIDHAIVTATLADGRRQMVIVGAADESRADASGWRVHGMKATLSGTYDLTGLSADETAQLGRPGDYELEPRFSAGAWRFTAV